VAVVSHDENHHDHGRRRRRRDSGHEHPMETTEQQECEPHKLLDEWMRASNNQIGLNKNLSIVQTIDMESSASLLQLHYGIPSILIEMTDEQVEILFDILGSCFQSLFESKMFRIDQIRSDLRKLTIFLII
jgi:hypothetical protein